LGQDAADPRLNELLRMATGAARPTAPGSGTDPDANATVHLLQVVAEAFVSAGEWPLVEMLRHQLDKVDDDLDVISVGRSLPASDGAIDIGYEGRIFLTIHGLARREVAARELEDCLSVVRFAYARFREVGPGARVTSGELREELGLDDLRLVKVENLTHSIPGFGGGGGSSALEWHRLLTAEITRFKHIETVEAMLDAIPSRRGLVAYRPESSVPETPSRRSSDAAPETRLSDDTERDAAARSANVFISVPERWKEKLGIPFRDRLGPSVHGIIVSDEPLVDGAYDPDEKVDAYLARSGAVVVFALGDIGDQSGRFTRPNISEELGRARSRPWLRDRILVLRQDGVRLPSNTNPAYEHLDPDRPELAFRKALEQLKEWGFHVEVGQTEPAQRAPGMIADAGRAQSPLDGDEHLRRALDRLPNLQSTSGGPSLALVLVAAPRQTLLRPSVLESEQLAKTIERDALFGPHTILDRGVGTESTISGNTLVVRQAASWVAVDGEGTMVILRPLDRTRNRGFALRGVIEEDVAADLEENLAFGDALLRQLDSRDKVTGVVVVAVLLGTNYNGWRTRAELAANPTSMNLNIVGGEQIAAHLTPALRPRTDLAEEAATIAEDLMILLRRAAREPRR
jgi:hypothetical protein